MKTETSQVEFVGGPICGGHMLIKKDLKQFVWPERAQVTDKVYAIPLEQPALLTHLYERSEECPDKMEYRGTVN